ncbi:MAG: nucleotidyl transferase AbiEii/AbiGii toxin family protein [Victivallaceae bacterium]|nr:nucleotidyl transferase AbiEii/AbiGii toxin family protein [Victivallaceae bacterium]
MEKLIADRCFTEDWLKSKASALSGDTTLVEKTVHAFALLGYLVQLEENFVFKGGTSLLLHLPTIKRLSIDIDIVLGGNIDEFIERIATIPGNSPFTGFKENQRGGARGLPNRRHFKFFYNSNISGDEEYILLDIVLDDPDFIPFIELKAIKGDFIEIETELTVKVPTIEGLFGDKLTAFAPHTSGVPFVTAKGHSMKMQVVKQLFDVGELFNIATDFDKVKIAYQKNFEKENFYQDNIFTQEAVLNDTIDMSELICLTKLRGFKARKDTDNIEEGLRSLTSHLLNVQFSINNEAKIAASKAFFIANAIKKNRTISLAEIKYSADKINQIKDVTLPEQYKFLQRLKLVLPEAFYYICQGIKE